MFGRGSMKRLPSLPKDEASDKESVNLTQKLEIAVDRSVKTTYETTTSRNSDRLYTAQITTRDRILTNTVIESPIIDRPPTPYPNMDPAASQIQTNYLVKQLEAANRSSPKIQTPDPSCHAFQNILAPSRQDEHHLSIQPFSTIPQPVTPIAPDQIYARITQLLQPLSLAQHGAMLTQLNAHYSARRDLHPGSPINPDGAPALTQKMHELGKAIESVDAWSKANNRLLHESLRAVSAAAAVQGEEGKEAKKNGE